MAAVLRSSFVSTGAVGFSASVSSTDGLRAQSMPAFPGEKIETTSQVRIRFSRGGCHKKPFYRLIAIDRKERRQGRPLEFLGWYDPLRKETQLNAPAIKKWLGNGAQPSDTVANLLKKALIL